MSEILLYSENNIAIITMNRPETYNAITTSFVNQFKESLTKIRLDKEVRAVIITGAGNGFCSGADLKMIEEQNLLDIENGRRFMSNAQDLIKSMIELPIPIIAAINGVCVGGGFGLALACDYMISARSATYSMIFPNVGLVPDLGSMYTLPQRIGLSQAKRLMYTAKILSSDQAYDMGIVEQVVEDNQLLDICLEEATTISNLSPRSISYTKHTLNHVSNMSLDTLLSTEGYQQAALFQTTDFNEAVTAFKEKRLPRFIGK